MSILMAPVKDGKFVETDTQASVKKATAPDNNGMDKDAFLQLLVAQMQYQDPLEPTSNTEYISQYAQFSQVEQMQNMAATSELARATSLVGQEVYIKTTNSKGESQLKYGKVDYVVFENNKAYLAIDESLYALEDLDTVVDLDYKNAFDKAYDFTVELNKLPVISSIDLSYAEKIDKLEKIYNEMTDYEKSFLTDENVEKLKKYIEKLKEVREAADKVEGGDKEDGEGEEDSKTEGTEGAGGTGQA